MENTFRPSRFLSLRATTPSPCTWEEIMQELTGERHAAATALFLWFLAQPMLEKLDRVKVKYGLLE